MRECVGKVEPALRNHSSEEAVREAADETEELREIDLLVCLAEGDLTALEPLYVRYRALVMTVLRRHGGVRPDELEDLCQEVFLSLQTSARKFRRDSSVRAFIAGIALHKGRKLSFRIGLHGRLLGGLFRRQEAAAPPQDTSDAMRDAQRLLDRLPEPQRTVLLLHRVEELSAEEIAAALNISVNTVWTRLHRARQTLREMEEQQ